MTEKIELLNEIKAKLKNVKVYQNIEFPDFSLKAKKQRINPEFRLQLFDTFDVKGKTIYDLGCSNGFYCFELAKRGARVIGVDKNKETIKINRLISEYYDLEIEFIEDDLLDETFYTDRMEKSDIVIFLSVIHHIYNKISSIRIQNEDRSQYYAICEDYLKTNFTRIDGKYFATGGGKCKLCGKEGTNAGTCPFNEKAVASGRVKPEKHNNTPLKEATKKGLFAIAIAYFARLDLVITPFWVVWSAVYFYHGWV